MTARDPSKPPRGWPVPRSGQVEVMLLGTYHMANPGRDAVNVEADDVLAPARQRELVALVDGLAGWTPDLVAVEQPAASQARVDERYRDYRGGGRRDERDETVQVGFRLADRLDHGRVAAVDARLPLDAHLPDGVEPSLDALPDPAAVDYPLLDVEETRRADEERLASATIPEYLGWCNEEARLRHNHALMFAAALDGGGADPDDGSPGERRADARDAAGGDAEAGTQTGGDPEAGTEIGGDPVAGDHAGTRMLTAWYERNLRTVANLWRAVGSDDERVLLVVGSGHVRVLRHLLDEAPMCCPVSPLAHLS